MRRTISWSVWPSRRAGASPLRAASPLRCAPLVHGCCMAAPGDSLRVRLRGGRWPSSPESLEARLPARARAPPVTSRAASAASRRDVAPAAPRPRDTRSSHFAPSERDQPPRPQCSISLCSLGSHSHRLFEFFVSAKPYRCEAGDQRLHGTRKYAGDRSVHKNQLKMKRQLSNFTNAIFNIALVLSDSGDVVDVLGRASGRIVVCNVMTSK